jgi:hypothetical protein
MSGDIAPLPQYALMARCSVKVQGQLYLYRKELIVYLHFTCVIKKNTENGGGEIHDFN